MTSTGSSNPVSFQITTAITVNLDYAQVWANGHEPAKITVSALNPQGQGVAGRTISLSANPKNGATINNATAVTDSFGKAYFVATSTKIGPVVFTANDIAHPSHMASAQVEFIQRRVVVFVQGIKTELNADNEQSTFQAIRDLLVSLGFSRPSIDPPETGKQCADIKDGDGDGVPNDGCSLILNYSYDSGGVSKDGLWAPFPYICQDTANSVADSILKLRDLILTFAKSNPNTRFTIVSHSQGGLIALQGTRLAVQSVPIDALITLDAALGGAPNLEATLTDWVTCWKGQASSDLTTLWNSASDHQNQGTTAKYLGGQTNEVVVKSLQNLTL